MDYLHVQADSSWYIHYSFKHLIALLKSLIIFLSHDICCGYSKEQSQWGFLCTHKTNVKTYCKKIFPILRSQFFVKFIAWCEPRHEISNNVVCATSKGSDQPAHMRSLIRAFTGRLNFLWTLSYLEFLSLTGGCTGSSESTLVRMPHCWKSHVMAQLCIFSGVRGKTCPILGWYNTVWHRTGKRWYLLVPIYGCESCRQTGTLSQGKTIHFLSLKAHWWAYSLGRPFVRSFVRFSVRWFVGRHGASTLFKILIKNWLANLSYLSIPQKGQEIQQNNGRTTYVKPFKNLPIRLIEYPSENIYCLLRCNHFATRQKQTTK